MVAGCFLHHVVWPWNQTLGSLCIVRKANFSINDKWVDVPASCKGGGGFGVAELFRIYLGDLLMNTFLKRNRLCRNFFSKMLISSSYILIHFLQHHEIDFWSVRVKNWYSGFWIIFYEARLGL